MPKSGVASDVLRKVHGRWSKLKEQHAQAPFKVIKEERIVTERDSRLVIPESLCQKAAILAHQGYQRLVKTKTECMVLRRENVWFSASDHLVEETIRSCNAYHDDDWGLRAPQQLKLFGAHHGSQLGMAISLDIMASQITLSFIIHVSIDRESQA